MNKTLLFGVLLFFLGSRVGAQEFRFTIEINTPTLQTTDPALFTELRSRLLDLINSRRWSSVPYKEHEKIRGSIVLTIRNEMANNAFEADMIIQAVRPVFGSTYESSLINHQDRELTFAFEPSTPIIYSENVFNDNLTSTIAFYLYYILGLDHDSFSLYGGDPYYQIANDIIAALPAEISQHPKMGWSSRGNGRNRYFLIENILSPRTRPFRKALYDYHRKGLDLMSEDPEQGKLAILDALKGVEVANKEYPNSMIVQMFTDAKGTEVADIFAVAQRPQKNEVYRIMTLIDPAQRNRYNLIRR